jgi:hypothetical protein
MRLSALTAMSTSVARWLSVCKRSASPTREANRILPVMPLPGLQQMVLTSYAHGNLRRRPIMVRAHMMAWAVMALLAPGLGAAAQQTGLSPQQEQLVQGSGKLLEFTAGSQLTPAERVRIYEVAVRDRKELDARDPRKAASDVPKYAAMLRVASGPPGPTSRRLRVTLLGVYADSADCLAVIGAHDPIVWADPPHKRVVTEQTLRGLRETYAWYAAMESLPPPGPDFIDRERAFLQGNLGGFPADMQDAVAATETYLPVAQQVVAIQSPARRASFVASMGRTKAKGDQLPVFAANVVRAVATGPGSHQGASGAGMATTYNNVLQDMMFVQPWTAGVMRGHGHNPFSNYGSVD